MPTKPHNLRRRFFLRAAGITPALPIPDSLSAGVLGTGLGILAGGGFRHGEYKIFPETGLGRAPLSNLFLAMLQRFGVETNEFALSTGALRDLELS